MSAFPENSQKIVLGRSLSGSYYNLLTLFLTIKSMSYEKIRYDELSRFTFQDGRWYYVDGAMLD